MLPSTNRIFWELDCNVSTSALPAWFPSVCPRFSKSQTFQAPQRVPGRDVLLCPHLIPLATKQMLNQHFLCLGCSSKFVHTNAISFKFMVGAGLAIAPWTAWFEVYLKLVFPLTRNKCLWLNICSFGLTNILWFKPLNHYYFSICFSFKKLCHIGWFIHIWLEISL